MTIGTFDGVHRGHQEIIRAVVRGAREAGAPAVVVTFHPHPKVVLRKREDPFYLTSVEERARLLGELGVDVVVTYPFTLQAAALTAEEFMGRLKTSLGLTRLCIGYDFALGRGREGDFNRLRLIGERLGYQVRAFDSIAAEGEIISSSRIRKALAEGEIELAARLLGRPYIISGKVIPGDQRGGKLGVPTANLDLWAERALPNSGVYACRVTVEGKRWNAVTNIGVRPTLEQSPVAPRVETHLFDYHGNLYDQTIHVEFTARLRDEQRFPSLEALVEQIQKDIAEARALLE
ncbi:MAG: bifunctional riboflavin kinase/FAD synthetase [Chloroflexi bacterium]|nr:bifunctional riboflavin kinase/FAD synthetase [Chloroflexota bacterium]